MGIPRLLFCVLIVALAPQWAMAQAYPSKPVRIIMPYPPGGGAHPVLTLFSEVLALSLNQSFVVDSRPGGNTIVGTTAAAKSSPDGYTLLGTTTAVLINHWLYPDLQYNVLKDLTPISTLTRSDSILVVNPTFPAKDLRQFVAYAAANPEKVTMASVSAVTLLNYQRFTNATAAKLAVINYKGGGQVMPDILAGRVDGAIGAVPAVQPFIKSGKLRALAIGGGKRNAALPEVPTFAEGGVADYDPNNWIALFAPARTPRDIVEKLNAEVRRAQGQAEVIGVLDKLGLAPFPASVSEADQFMRIETERFGKAIKDAGLKAEDL